MTNRDTPLGGHPICACGRWSVKAVFPLDPDRQDGDEDLARLPVAVRRLLLRDASVAIGLSLRPTGLDVRGRRLLRRLLVWHAGRDPAARMALVALNKGGVGHDG